MRSSNIFQEKQKLMSKLSHHEFQKYYIPFNHFEAFSQVINNIDDFKVITQMFSSSSGRSLSQSEFKRAIQICSNTSINHIPEYITDILYKIFTNEEGIKWDHEFSVNFLWIHRKFHASKKRELKWFTVLCVLCVYISRYVNMVCFLSLFISRPSFCNWRFFGDYEKSSKPKTPEVMASKNTNVTIQTLR